MFIEFKTTAMSAFESNHRDGEYPIINLEAENEHFPVSDSVIAWIEACKSNSRNGVVITNITSDKQRVPTANHLSNNLDELHKILPSPSGHHQLSASGMAWSLARKFVKNQGADIGILSSIPNGDTFLVDQEHQQQQQQPVHDRGIRSKSPERMVPILNPEIAELCKDNNNPLRLSATEQESPVRMRGNDEWAPPRAQIIFNIHEENNFRKLLQRQNYRCAGCGTKIDLELARRLVLYCHYLGKYFCKCCFSHKAIHLPGYILQKWDFHKYPVSHFALQFLDRIANEPLFNINDINSSLYRKVKKLRLLIDIRMQLYYLKIYISTCTQTDKLDQEYASFTHQHLLQDDVHLYSLNNLIEIQHGKLYEYLNDLVSRSIAHIAKCDKCRGKGHYCQLCGPSSLMSSLILSSANNHDYLNKGESQALRLKHSSSAGQNISMIASAIQGRGSPIEMGGSRGHSRSSSGNFSNFATPSTPTGSTGPMVGPPPATAAASTNDHELIFPFEIGRVALCRACGCCFHLQCFNDAGQNCPKCERIQRRNAEIQDSSTDTSGFESTSITATTLAAAATTTTTATTTTAS